MGKGMGILLLIIVILAAVVVADYLEVINLEAILGDLGIDIEMPW